MCGQLDASELADAVFAVDSVLASGHENTLVPHGMSHACLALLTLPMLLLRRSIFGKVLPVPRFLVQLLGCMCVLHRNLNTSCPLCTDAGRHTAPLHCVYRSFNQCYLDRSH